MPRKSKKKTDNNPSVSMIRDYNYRLNIMNNETSIYSMMTNVKENMTDCFKYLKNWKNEALMIKIGVYEKEEVYPLNTFDFDRFNPESMETQISLF